MKIECPLPRTDLELITLGHGSGGVLTHRLLQTGVFDLLKNDKLDQQHDGAVLNLAGRIAMSTDSYVVTPIFFPGGDIGELAVNGTVNDLAMCGADAKYLTLSFIIEEGLPLHELQRVVYSIQKAAGRAGVEIVTGDTKVVEKGKGDKLFINTAGIGFVHHRASIHHGNIEAGDRIIISGEIASHGIAIMSKREGLEFETDICSDTVNLNRTVLNLVEHFGASVHFMRDPTRGGVASVLNEVAGLTNFGYHLQQNSIPINEQVEGACEMLGLDPLYVANEGIFIAIVNQRAADDMVQELRKDHNGSNASVIGEVVTEHPGKVVISSSAGGRRVVPFLTGEQLPRIC